MVCSAKMVDVCECLVPLHKVNEVLDYVDVIRRVHGYAIAVHSCPIAEKATWICILLELSDISLPIEQMEYEFAKPIAEIILAT